MSFLFKKILGERVVHPQAGQAAASGENRSAAPTANAEDAAKKASQETPGPTAARESTSEKEAPREAPIDEAESDGRYRVVARDFASLTQQRREAADKRSPAVNGVTGKGANGGALKRTHAPQTDTRTLLLRVQTCSVSQDLRDTFRALVDGAEDLPYVLAAREVLHLVEPLRTHADDAQVVSSALQVLADLTDVSTYPSSGRTAGGSNTSSSGAYSVSERERRQIRNGFAHELIPEVPLFVELLRRSRTGSGVDGVPTSAENGDTSRSVHGSSNESPMADTKLNCVRLLLHLEEYKPGEVHKLLLGCHGVGPVVDLLSDTSSDGRLRRETLALVAALTATDTDMQTLFAFENGLDSLFHVVEAEGGIDGGVVVSECLSTARNTLRGNQATQKLFLEMGGAAHLCPLLAVVSSRLETAATSTAGANTSPLFTPLTNMQSIIVLSVVSVVSCVLRDTDVAEKADSGASANLASGTGAPGANVRLRLVECGLLRPLASIALSGAAVDDAVRIESMRALGSLLTRCRPALREFMESGSPSTSPSHAVTMLMRADAPQTVVRWSFMRATLEYLCTSGDRTLMGATARVIGCVLEDVARSPDGAAALSREIREGFAPIPGVSGFDVVSHATVCSSGAALALALTGVTPHASGKYYAARVLVSLLLHVPGLAAELAFASWRTTTTTSHENDPVALPTLPTVVTLSPASPATFFNAFVTYYIYCVGGGHASQRMDTAALGACTYALLAWLSEVPACEAVVLAEPRWFRKLLDGASGASNSHVRFWCACVAARLCCLAPRDRIPSSSSFPAPPTREAMLEQFVNVLRGPAVLDELAFDVGASSPQWAEACTSAANNTVVDVFSPAVAAAASGVPVYDAAFVAELNKTVEAFKRICPRSGFGHGSGAGCDAESSLKSTDRLSYLQSQQQQPAQGLGATGAEAVTTVALQEENEALRARVAALEEAAAATAASVINEAPSPAPAEASLVVTQEEDNEEVLRLREDLRVLEDALLSKEEEHRQLASTLNMMEAHLQRRLAESGDGGSGVLSGGTAVSTLRPTRETASVEVQTEVMEPLIKDDGYDAHALQSACAKEEQRQLEELRRQLAAAAADRDDLLLMVAELNDECQSVRAMSTMPTPGRELTALSGSYLITPQPQDRFHQRRPQQQQERLEREMLQQDPPPATHLWPGQELFPTTSSWVPPVAHAPGVQEWQQAGDSVTACRVPLSEKVNEAAGPLAAMHVALYSSEELQRAGTPAAAGVDTHGIGSRPGGDRNGADGGAVAEQEEGEEDFWNGGSAANTEQPMAPTLRAGMNPFAVGRGTVGDATDQLASMNDGVAMVALPAPEPVSTAPTATDISAALIYPGDDDRVVGAANNPDTYAAFIDAFGVHTEPSPAAVPYTFSSDKNPFALHRDSNSAGNAGVAGPTSPAAAAAAAMTPPEEREVTVDEPPPAAEQTFAIPAVNPFAPRGLIEAPSTTLPAATMAVNEQTGFGEDADSLSVPDAVTMNNNPFARSGILGGKEVLQTDDGVDAFFQAPLIQPKSAGTGIDMYGEETLPDLR